MKLYRKIALLLAICTVATVILPFTVLAADDTVVYKGYQARSLLGGTSNDLNSVAPDGKTYRQKLKEEYQKGNINWYYLTEYNTRTNGHLYISSSYGLRIGCNTDSWAAIAFRAPGNGTYNLNLEHYVSEWGAEVALAYIFPKPDLEESALNAYIDDVIAAGTPDALLDYHESAARKSATALGSYKFEAGMEYILVLNSQSCYSGDDGVINASYMFFTKLIATKDPVSQTSPTTEIRPVDLGTVTTEFGSRTQSAVCEVNGYDYYFLPVKGGILHIYNLDYYCDNNPKTDPFLGYVTTDITNAWGCSTGADGKIYVSGDAKYFYRYDPLTGKGEKVEFVSKSTAAYDISADQYGNVLLGSNGSTANSGPVYYEAATGKTTTYYNLDARGAASDCSALTKDDDYIYAYMEGTVLDVTTRSVFKVEIKTGKVVAELDVTRQMAGVGHLTALTLVDGVLIGGCSGLSSMIAIDTETWKLIDIGISQGCNGEVTPVRNGKAYFIASGLGLCEYDVATRTARNVKKGYGGTAMRVSGGCFVTVDVDGDGADEELIFTNGGACAPVFFDTVNSYRGRWDDMVRTEIGASTPIHSVVASNDGSNQIFVGGYVTNNCGTYHPDGEYYSFYTTDGQTDCQVMYEGVLYAGTYSRCTLSKVDLNTGTHTNLMSLSSLNQKRIHTITAGGGKVYFSSIPDTYDLGGYLAWYDLNTGEPYYVKLSEISPLFEDQIIISMAYKDGYLYCGSSVHGGSDATPSKSECYFFVFDVANRKLVAQEKVKYPYIASLNMDLKGTVWGVISKTLFTVSYSKAGGIAWTMKHTLDDNTPSTEAERFAIGKSSQSMTPRTIWFGNNGEIYTNLGYSDGIYRFDVDNAGQVTGYKKLLDGTYHDYALGEDGNLYYASGKNLMLYVLNYEDQDLILADRINQQLKNALMSDPAQCAELISAAMDEYGELSNVQKGMVDSSMLMAAKRRLAIALIHNLPDTVTQSDGAAVGAARNAYNALTAGQKDRVSNYDKLLAAENALGKVPEEPDPSDPPDPDDPIIPDDPDEPNDPSSPSEPDEPSDPNAPDPTDPEATVPDATDDTGDGKTGRGWIIAASVGGVLLIAAAMAFAIPALRKKK